MSSPAIMLSIAPASAADRLSGPMWSRLGARGNTPCRLTRPQVGFSPVTPLADAGKRIDPPVSLPIVPNARPAAVATPEPLDDAPA